MGRGRAKAKQTKVARELKYQTRTMDVDALQRELKGDDSHNGQSDSGHSEDSDTDDYGDYHG